eukprot:TRINITY_DN6578_c0_g1_i1.p1 TRINITY_DN6578_c0_g1~~TRINITY_DN6578_c0_g1_i1.p1  ORF type:complete len:3402 (+),score=654.45 TRINITY_DN6578_c0_g1_i1:36-10241(+)
MKPNGIDTSPPTRQDSEDDDSEDDQIQAVKMINNITLTQDDINKEVIDLWETIQRQEHNSADREEELETMKVMLRGTAIRERKKVLAETEDLRKECQAEVARLQKLLQQKESAHSTATSSCTSLTSSLQQANDRNKTLQSDYNAALVVIKSLEDQTDRFRTDIQTLSEDSAALRDVQQELIKSQTELQTLRTSHSDSVLSFKEEISRLRLRQTASDGRVAAKDRELDVLKDQLHTSKSRCDELSKEVAELNQQLEASLLKLNDREQHIAITEEKLAIANEGNSDIGKQLQTARQNELNSAKAVATIPGLRQSLLQLEEMVESKSNTIITLQGETHDLSNTISSRDNTIAELERKLEDLNQKYDQEIQKNTYTESLLKSQIEKVSEKTDLINSMVKESRVLKEKSASLAKSLLQAETESIANAKKELRARSDQQTLIKTNRDTVQKFEKLLEQKTQIINQKQFEQKLLTSKLLLHQQSSAKAFASNLSTSHVLRCYLKLEQRAREKSIHTSISASLVAKFLACKEFASVPGSSHSLMVTYYNKFRRYWSRHKRSASLSRLVRCACLRLYYQKLTHYSIQRQKTSALEITLNTERSKCHQLETDIKNCHRQHNDLKSTHSQLQHDINLSSSRLSESESRLKAKATELEDLQQRMSLLKSVGYPYKRLVAESLRKKTWYKDVTRFYMKLVQKAALTKYNDLKRSYEASNQQILLQKEEMAELNEQMIRLQSDADVSSLTARGSRERSASPKASIQADDASYKLQVSCQSALFNLQKFKRQLATYLCTHSTNVLLRTVFTRLMQRAERRRSQARDSEIRVCKKELSDQSKKLFDLKGTLAICESRLSTQDYIAPLRLHQLELGKKRENHLLAKNQRAMTILRNTTKKSCESLKASSHRRILSKYFTSLYLCLKEFRVKTCQKEHEVAMRRCENTSNIQIAEIDRLQKMNNDLLVTNEKLSTKVAAVSSENLQNRLASRDSAILQGDNALLAEENHVLKNQLQEARTTISSNTITITKHSQLIERLNTQISDSESQLSQYKTSITNEQQHVKELQKTVSLERETQAILNSKIEELVSNTVNHKDLMVQLDFAEDNLTAAQREVTDLKTTLQTTTEKLLESEKQSMVLRDSSVASASEFALLNTKVELLTRRSTVLEEVVLRSVISLSTKYLLSRYYGYFKTIVRRHRLTRVLPLVETASLNKVLSRYLQKLIIYNTSSKHKRHSEKVLTNVLYGKTCQKILRKNYDCLLMITFKGKLSKQISQQEENHALEIREREASIQKQGEVVASLQGANELLNIEVAKLKNTLSETKSDLSASLEERNKLSRAISTQDEAIYKLTVDRSNELTNLSVRRQRQKSSQAGVLETCTTKAFMRRYFQYLSMNLMWSPLVKRLSSQQDLVNKNNLLLQQVSELYETNTELNIAADSLRYEQSVSSHQLLTIQQQTKKSRCIKLSNILHRSTQNKVLGECYRKILTHANLAKTVKKYDQQTAPATTAELSQSREQVASLSEELSVSTRQKQQLQEELNNLSYQLKVSSQSQLTLRHNIRASSASSKGKRLLNTTTIRTIRSAYQFLLQNLLVKTLVSNSVRDFRSDNSDLQQHYNVAVAEASDAKQKVSSLQDKVAVLEKDLSDSQYKLTMLNSESHQIKKIRSKTKDIKFNRLCHSTRVSTLRWCYTLLGIHSVFKKECKKLLSQPSELHGVSVEDAIEFYFKAPHAKVKNQLGKAAFASSTTAFVVRRIFFSKLKAYAQSRHRERVSQQEASSRLAKSASISHLRKSFYSLTRYATSRVAKRDQMRVLQSLSTSRDRFITHRYYAKWQYLLTLQRIDYELNTASNSHAAVEERLVLAKSSFNIFKQITSCSLMRASEQSLLRNYFFKAKRFVSEKRSTASLSNVLELLGASRGRRYLFRYWSTWSIFVYKRNLVLMNEEIQRLEDQQAQILSENEGLKKQLSEGIITITNIEESTQSVMNANNDLVEQVKELTQANENTVALYKEELTNKENKINKLTQENAAQVKQLQSDLRKSATTASRHAADVVDLGEKLKLSQEEYSSLRSKYDSLQLTVSDHEDIEASLTQKLQLAMTEIDRSEQLHDKYVSLEESLMNVESELEHERAHVTELNDTVAELNTALQTSGDTISNLRYQMEVSNSTAATNATASFLSMQSVRCQSLLASTQRHSLRRSFSRFETLVRLSNLRASRLNDQTDFSEQLASVQLDHTHQLSSLTDEVTKHQELLTQATKDSDIIKEDLLSSQQDLKKSETCVQQLRDSIDELKRNQEYEIEVAVQASQQEIRNYKKRQRRIASEVIKNHSHHKLLIESYKALAVYGPYRKAIRLQENAASELQEALASSQSDNNHLRQSLATRTGHVCEALETKSQRLVISTYYRKLVTRRHLHRRHTKLSLFSSCTERTTNNRIRQRYFTSLMKMIVGRRNSSWANSCMSAYSIRVDRSLLQRSYGKLLLFTRERIKDAEISRISDQATSETETLQNTTSAKQSQLKQHLSDVFNTKTDSSLRRRYFQTLTRKMMYNRQLRRLTRHCISQETSMNKSLFRKYYQKLLANRINVHVRSKLIETCHCLLVTTSQGTLRSYYQKWRIFVREHVASFEEKKKQEQYDQNYQQLLRETESEKSNLRHEHTLLSEKAAMLEGKVSHQEELTAKLRKDLQSAYDTISDLERDAVVINQRIADAEEAATDFKQTIKDTQLRLKRHQQQYDKLQQDTTETIRNRDNDLSSVMASLKNCESELATKTKEGKEQLYEINDLRSQIKHKNKQLTEEENRYNTLSKESQLTISNINLENESLQQALKKLKQQRSEEHNQLQSELDVLVAKLNNAESLLRTTSNRLREESKTKETLGDKLKEATEHTINLAEMIQDTLVKGSTQAEELEARIVDLTESQDTLNNLLSTANAELSEKGERIQQLEGKLSSATTTNQSIEEELHGLRIQRGSLQAKLQIAEMRLEEARTSLQEHRQQVVDLSGEVSASRDKLSDLEESHSLECGNHQRSQNRVRDLESRLARVTLENETELEIRASKESDLQTQLSMANDATKRRDNDIHKLQHANETLTSQLASWKNRVTEYECHIETAATNLGQMETLSSTAEAELVRLQEEIDAITIQNEDYQQKCLTLQVDNSKLLEQLRLLSEEKSDLAAKLDLTTRKLSTSSFLETGFRFPSLSSRANTLVHIPVNSLGGGVEEDEAIQRQQIEQASDRSNWRLVFIGITVKSYGSYPPFVIQSISDGSPAAASSLSVGDHIVAVDGVLLHSRDEFCARLSAFNGVLPGRSPIRLGYVSSPQYRSDCVTAFTNSEPLPRPPTGGVSTCEIVPTPFVYPPYKFLTPDEVYEQYEKVFSSANRPLLPREQLENLIDLGSSVPSHEVDSAIEELLVRSGTNLNAALWEDNAEGILI